MQSALHALKLTHCIWLMRLSLLGLGALLMVSDLLLLEPAATLASQGQSVGAPIQAQAPQAPAQGGVPVGPILIVLALAWLLLLTELMAHNVRRRLGGEPYQVAALIAQMAEGDLRSALRERAEDEGAAVGALGQLRRALSHWQRVVAGIRQVAQEIERGVRSLEEGNNQLINRSEQQGESLQETAASLEQMTSTVRQNAANAQSASDLADGARQTAERGNAVVQQTVTAMNAINQSSQRIANIIGVIDEIAFQTNLLALNAAVEAARAGEQGRGFAVVAAEVRNLAQRSAAAAKEIKTLIQESGAKVEEGSRLADSAGHTLQEIVTAAQRVSDIVGEIASANAEQSIGIEQVSNAVMQMDGITQQNRDLAHKICQTGGELSAKLAELFKLFAFFHLDEAATPRQAASPPAPSLRAMPPPKPVAKPAPAAVGARGGQLTPGKALAVRPPANIIYENPRVVAADKPASVGKYSDKAGDWEEF